MKLKMVRVMAMGTLIVAMALALADVNRAKAGADPESQIATTAWAAWN